MKVVINVPAPTALGGVRGYFSTIREHFDEDMEYFVTGNPLQGAGGDEGVLTRCGRLCGDYIKYALLMSRTRPRVAHLNPSLQYRALLRDAVFLMIAKMSGAKVLVFIHGWDRLLAASLSRDGLRRRLFRCFYCRADAAVVLSGEFRDQLKGFGFKKAIYCETTNVDDAVFRSGPAPGVSRKEPGDPFCVLFLTRMEKAKGIFETLEAYAMLAGAHPRVSLVAAGDGSALEEAKLWVTRRGLGNVTFTGFVEGPDKDEAFRNASCYVLPTVHGEGMPTTVLEAMAWGLPVLTSPVGGVRDFFQTGEMGYLIESPDPSAYAAKLEILIQNPSLGRKMGEYNRVYAAEHFAASKVARRLQSIYSAL